MPKVGACMVRQKGLLLSGLDGADHVAVLEKVVRGVEAILQRATMVISRFGIRYVRKAQMADGVQDLSVHFLGLFTILRLKMSLRTKKSYALYKKHRDLKQEMWQAFLTMQYIIIVRLLFPNG